VCVRDEHTLTHTHNTLFMALFNHCPVFCPNTFMIHATTRSFASLTTILSRLHGVLCEFHSKPNALPGKDLLNTAGVRATLGLSGYRSKEDFINQQNKFVDSLVVALKASGKSIDASYIVVVHVCYGNDCTTFYTGRRRLAAELIEVDFQVNTPDGDAESVFSTMSSDAFLSAISFELSRVLGRHVDAAYIRAPEKVSKSKEASENNLVGSKTQKEQLETQVGRSTAHFPVWIIVVILVLLLGVASAAGLYLVWRRRRENDSEEVNLKQAKTEFNANHSNEDRPVNDEEELTLPKARVQKTAGRPEIDDEVAERLREAKQKCEETERRLKTVRWEAERKRKENEMLANEIAEISSFSLNLSINSGPVRYLDLSLTRASSIPNKSLHPDAAIQNTSEEAGISIEDPMPTSMDESFIEDSTHADDSMMLFDVQETPIRMTSADVSLVEALNGPDAETGMQEDEALKLAVGADASGPWFTPPPPADPSASENRRRCSAHAVALFCTLARAYAYFIVLCVNHA
jgi:hypothetical protein